MGFNLELNKITETDETNSSRSDVLARSAASITLFMKYAEKRSLGLRMLEDTHGKV